MTTADPAPGTGAAPHPLPLSPPPCHLCKRAGNASQEELMIKDECILVDEADTVTGHASKYDSHRCAARQLHR